MRPYLHVRSVVTCCCAASLSPIPAGSREAPAGRDVALARGLQSERVVSPKPGENRGCFGGGKGIADTWPRNLPVRQGIVTGREGRAERRVQGRAEAGGKGIADTWPRNLPVGRGGDGS
eukprot:2341342-Prymnesium_polylepis.2